MAGAPPIPPKGPKLVGGKRVTQAKAATSAADIRKRAALGKTAQRRTSGFAQRTAFGKGAWQQRVIRDKPGGGVRSAAAGRKAFRPAVDRKTKAGAMFQAGQFIKSSTDIKDRMLAILEASELQRKSAERAKAMRAKTLARRERVRLGKKTQARRVGRPRKVSENQITTAAQVGKHSTQTHDYAPKDLEAPKPHPEFLKLLKILKKQGKCKVK